jgi:hypothetical protein
MPSFFWQKDSGLLIVSTHPDKNFNWQKMNNSRERSLREKISTRLTANITHVIIWFGTHIFNNSNVSELRIISTEWYCSCRSQSHDSGSKLKQGDSKPLFIEKLSRSVKSVSWDQFSCPCTVIQHAISRCFDCKSDRVAGVISDLVSLQIHRWTEQFSSLHLWASSIRWLKILFYLEIWWVMVNDLISVWIDDGKSDYLIMFRVY